MLQMLIDNVVGPGIDPGTFRFSGGRSANWATRPQTAVKNFSFAVLTGFEPATSALTGRRALQTAPQDQSNFN